jgi:hypothetical protein
VSAPRLSCDRLPCAFSPECTLSILCCCHSKNIVALQHMHLSGAIPSVGCPANLCVCGAAAPPTVPPALPAGTTGAGAVAPPIFRRALQGAFWKLTPGVLASLCALVMVAICLRTLSVQHAMLPCHVCVCCSGTDSFTGMIPSGINVVMVNMRRCINAIYSALRYLQFPRCHGPLPRVTCMCGTLYWYRLYWYHYVIHGRIMHWNDRPETYHKNRLACLS